MITTKMMRGMLAMVALAGTCACAQDVPAAEQSPATTSTDAPKPKRTAPKLAPAPKASTPEDLPAAPAAQVAAQPAPADVSAPLAAARQMLGAGDYAGADRALRAVLVTAPGSADAHFMLGFALLHEQKPTESLNEYTTGAKARNPGPEELIGVASDYILLKDYTDAEKWLQVAAKLGPERSFVWYLLGRTQYNLNHWGDAERAFLTCLRLDPKNLRAQYNLGLVYEAQQKPDAAVAAYKQAIAMEDGLATKDLQPYLDLGMLLRKQGKLIEALPALVIAAGNGSRNPLAHQELGLAYEEAGKNDEAIGELKAAIRLAPQVEALHFFLGRMYRKAGHKDEAAAEFATAAKLSGTKSDAGVPNLDVTE